MTQGPAADMPEPAHPDVVKIGLWGPPQSGKTTYLAALPIAVGDENARNGSWLIFPRSRPSRELLEEFERVLVEERRFPQTTPAYTTRELEWLFVGELARSRYDQRRLLRSRRKARVSRFLLDLIDVHGGAYRGDVRKPTSSGKESLDEGIVDIEAAASAALDHLATAQGIIFLFDPIGERDNRNSAAYVRWTANELLERAAKNGRLPGRHLEQQVSVCITKFDHPELFYRAREMNLVTYGPDGMPRVRDEDAKQFFDELCFGKFWSDQFEAGQESAEFVRSKINNLFRPDRVRYFVTSSIGFWMAPPTGDRTRPWFDPDHPSNYHERDGASSIKGAVRPINVLEPLISLQRRIGGG